MIMYSPKSKDPALFRKNTVKNQLAYSQKIVGMGSQIEFELRPEIDDTMEETASPGSNMLERSFTFLRDRFYERMKLFFDFDERYREKSTTFDLDKV